MIDPAKTAELTAKGINALGWHVVSRSEETCSDCLNQLGKHWRIDGTLIQDAIPFAWPPIHLGCRCLAIPMKFPNELLAVILAGQPVERRSPDGRLPGRDADGAGKNRTLAR